MLPDIASHKTASHISGFAQPSGTGILSRSFEDLHPQPDRYEVIWNGTISAQEQKAEQRSPSLEPDVKLPELRPMDGIRDIVRAAGGPINVRQVADRCSFTYGVVEVTLRRLALRGELSVCEQLMTDGKGARRFIRVYSMPLKAAA
jgi:hypothetical protein